VKRFNGALHLMKKRVRVEGELWWLTTPKGSTRSEIAAIQKRITRLQDDHGLYGYSAWIFETKPKLHAHIVFVGNPEIAAALKRSAVCRGCDVDFVSDPDGLAKNCLSKERTPQAGYGRSDLGGRIRGSHRIEGGGDRVRLSRELERDAIEAGLVNDWRHTNAKRKPAQERKERRCIRKRRRGPPVKSCFFPNWRSRYLACTHSLKGTCRQPWPRRSSFDASSAGCLKPS
jgi:hypothetical protein